MSRHSRIHSAVSCSKMAEQIELLFGFWTQLDQMKRRRCGLYFDHLLLFTLILTECLSTMLPHTVSAASSQLLHFSALMTWHWVSFLYADLPVCSCLLIFTARRNACIASAVLATAIPSVCPSVHQTLVLCQNDSTWHGAVCTVG